MKKALFLLFILPLISRSQDFAAKADAYLTDMTAQKKFTGVVLVAKGGKILFEKGYGWANERQKKPNTVETEFRIASITKQFTAALILQLAEKGKINVKDKVSKYLPDYKKGDSITIHNLLSHTSGLPTNLPGLTDPMNLASLDEKIAAIKACPLSSKPGTKFEYSNSNFILLASIAEKLSGKPYGELLKTQILDKAGMQHSGLDANRRPGSNEAIGYARIDTRQWVAAPYRDMDAASGAGGMYSTVGDLYLWDRALYTTNILSADAKRQMFTPNLRNYGYGYNIVRTKGHKEYWHNGATNGFLSIISRYPDDDACIVVLMNDRQTKPGVIKSALQDMLFAN